MKKILIIASNAPKDSPAVQRYHEFAPKDSEITVRWLSDFFAIWDGQALRVIDAITGEEPTGYDVVHIAGWKSHADIAFALATWLEHQQVPFVGHTLLDWYADSKLGELVRLTTAGLPHPRSFYADDNTRLLQLYDWAVVRCGLQLPVVVKSTLASRGEHNYLVRSRDELAALPLDAGHRYLIQECIPNKCDYRLVVLGGKTKIIIRRTRLSDDTHLNNISQGADATLVDLADFPAEAIAVAEQAAKALGREDIAGVDLLLDEQTNKPYVLEVNRTPHMSLGEPAAVAAKMQALFAYLESV
ncbi:MAG TPA: ATP-grasp domain-containing protein [Candidatus Saccharimonadales bacterium]|nr:ATP-grasp domain-containing protein [Candidatus Saccharimonadales bacterium]